jgi:hypothetical protein
MFPPQLSILGQAEEMKHGQPPLGLQTNQSAIATRICGYSRTKNCAGLPKIARDLLLFARREKLNCSGGDCPGQGSNNRRFYREIKRFRKRRCKKRCNRPRISRACDSLAVPVGDNQIGDPWCSTSASGDREAKEIVPMIFNCGRACVQYQRQRIVQTHPIVAVPSQSPCRSESSPR